MACDVGREKLDAYLDGELDSSEAAALSAHMRNCNSCAADALEGVQMKRAVAAAGKRYEPRARFREKITNHITTKPQRNTGWMWILAVPALSVIILSVGVALYVNHESARRQRVYSELTDLHVATLASATPVDVISTDRHTVKPWFQGKIPFTFNLPDLQGTEFTLIGGRVAYLAQSPGAHLIYQLRKHEISVFIFQDRGTETGLPSGTTNALSFNVDSWTQNGLRYFVLGDVSSEDIQALSKLLQDAK
ncbi:MAG TPA: anti-sigma factor [Terriglobales bacterium]|nr:anti-sigma factor [Terriglobales bacterium]